MKIKAKKQTTQPFPPEAVKADGSLLYLIQERDTAIQKGQSDRGILLAGLVRSTENPALQTPLSALNSLIVAGQAGVVAPAWAVQLVDQGLRRRIQDQDAKLDTIFGFAPGGEAEAVFRTLRNEKVIVRIHIMVSSGEGVGAACLTMAKRLRDMRDWNQTCYDLGFTRDGSTDPDRVAKRLQTLYQEWKRTTPAEDLGLWATLGKSPDLLPLLLNE
ncbi:MAG TPA: hypothetical protein DD706_24600 [Nitrospiraceae bacterium]|nr:hypothetical protein [Nitrospiraceae bacterium]